MRVRTLMCTLLLVACQSAASPDECDRVVDHVIALKRTLNKIPTAESEWESWRRQMTSYCHTNFSAADRVCVLAIRSMEDLAACMSKVKGTAPPRTPDR